MMADGRHGGWQGLAREDWELLHRSRTRQAFYEKAVGYLYKEGGDHWSVPLPCLQRRTFVGSDE